MSQKGSHNTKADLEDKCYIQFFNTNTLYTSVISQHMLLTKIWSPHYSIIIHKRRDKTDKFACCVLGQGTYTRCLYLSLISQLASAGSLTRRPKKSLRSFLVDVPW